LDFEITESIFSNIRQGIVTMTIRTTIAVFLTAILILTASGCGRAPDAAAKKGPIRIAVNIWPGYAYAFIAKEKGFFAHNGVDVELILKQDSEEAKALYVSDQAEGFFTVLPDIVMLNAEGNATKAVVIVDESTTGDVIIGRPELNSLKDLGDKKISCEAFNSFSQMFVLEALKKAGVDEADIRLELVPALGVLAALDEGRIAAGHTWEPTKSMALEKGYKILAAAEDVPGIIIDVLAFSDDIIKERPDDIRKVLRSLFEARDFLYNHNAEALEIMARNEGMSTAEMKAGIDGVKMFGLRDNVDAFRNRKGDNLLSASLNIITGYLLKQGQLLRVPGLSEISETAFIMELAGEK
jgi:NitT/TauT family transport system substrate-binding protein